MRDTFIFITYENKLCLKTRKESIIYLNENQEKLPESLAPSKTHASLWTLQFLLKAAPVRCARTLRPKFSLLAYYFI